MRTVFITIDSRDIDILEHATIVFYTDRRVVLKQELKKSMNQTFSIDIEKEERLFLRFDHQRLSNLVAMAKHFCHLLTAFMPEKYFYDSCFAAFEYKHGLEYELKVEDTSSVYLKYHEATPEEPIARLGTQWTGRESVVIEHGMKKNVKNTYRSYVIRLVLISFITLVLSGVAVWDLFYPTPYHRSVVPYIVSFLLMVMSVIYPVRALYTSQKQYDMMIKNGKDLSCFRQH